MLKQVLLTECNRFCRYTRNARPALKVETPSGLQHLLFHNSCESVTWQIAARCIILNLQRTAGDHRFPSHLEVENITRLGADASGKRYGVSDVAQGKDFRILRTWQVQ